MYHYLLCINAIFGWYNCVVVIEAVLTFKKMHKIKKGCRYLFCELYQRQPNYVLCT